MQRSVWMLAIIAGACLAILPNEASAQSMGPSCREQITATEKLCNDEHMGDDVAMFCDAMIARKNELVELANSATQEELDALEAGCAESVLQLVAVVGAIPPDPAPDGTKQISRAVEAACWNIAQCGVQSYETCLEKGKKLSDEKASCLAISTCEQLKTKTTNCD